MKCQATTQSGTFCNKEAKHDLDGLMVCDLHLDPRLPDNVDTTISEESEMERRTRSRGLRPTVKGGTLAREAHEDSIEQEQKQEETDFEENI